MTRPHVSIGLPVYNGERLLPRAVESFLAQDYPDWELVICDNSSEDRTADIARTYAAADPRIRYHRNQSNIGLVGNFNRTFELARGDLFKWATHDDWCDRTFLSRCVDVLHCDPRTVLACTEVAIHDEHGAMIETWNPGVDFGADRAVTRAHHMIWYSGETHPLFGVVRREALRRTGLMQSYLGSSRLMLTHLSTQGRIVVLPETAYHYTYYRPVGRTYGAYNNPANATRLPLRTWRLGREHAVTIARSQLPIVDKARLELEVFARFGVHDARRLAAEVYHSGRILVARARRAVMA